jgi:16S rRNA (guanine527-N7)-methyltransferase
MQRYAELLADAGVVRGLIGPREVPRLWERHLLNCVAVASLIPQDAAVADIGSGAGLPGLVLAIVRNDLRMTLIEPMARRVAFLEECATALGLDNTGVVRARAEELHGVLEVTTVVARAVSPLKTLIPLALPLLLPGGQLVALKGASVGGELDQARAVLKQWPGSTITVVRAGAGVLDEPATAAVVTVGRFTQQRPARANRSQRGRRT